MLATSALLAAFAPLQMVLAALVFRPPMSGTPGPLDMALRHLFLGEAPSTSVSSEDLVHLGASTCTVGRAVPGKFEYWACAYLEPLWARASEAAVRCVDRAGVETERTARSLVREGASLSVVGNGGKARKDGALIDSADSHRAPPRAPTAPRASASSPI